MLRHNRILHVLLIDDDEEEFLQLKDILASQPAEVGYPYLKLEWVPSYEQGLTALEAHQHDVYLIDYRLGGKSGMDLLRAAREAGVDEPIIILTGQGSYQVDLTAMQLGAADYLVKSQLTLPLLERSIRYSLEQTNIQNRLEELVREQTKELVQTVNNLKEEIRRREESETLFRTLANTTSAAIFILRDNHILYANPAARFVTGYTPEELVKMDLSDLVHPSYRKAIELGAQVHPWSGDLPLRYEVKIIRRDGQERWLDMTTGQMEFENQASRMITAFDITERDQAERALEQAMDRLESEVAQRTNELRERTQELSALHAATAALLTTLNLDELFGQILNAAQSAIPAARHAWLHLVSTENQRLELCAVRGAPPQITATAVFPDAHNYPLRALQEARPLLIAHTDLDVMDQAAPFSELPDPRVSIRSIIVAPLGPADQPLGVLSLSSPEPRTFTPADLNMLAHFAATTTAAIQNAIQYKNVETLATTDPLTEQLNRRAFMDLGQRELERHRRMSQPISALIIDLDDFKRVNDTHGHLVGDQALRGFVDRCCERIRKIDLFGRYGGDEFTVLLPRTDQDAAVEIAERIRLAICETPLETDAGRVDLTVSIGVSVSAAEHHDLRTLLGRADAALYQAKQSGRNSVRVYSAT
jgi:diguanylate cyclase (GGDEF)-like protein/PAS domain S-box-containing protein